GVDAQWTRRNLTRRADSLTLAATLGEKTQSISALLTPPDGASLGRAQNFSLSTIHETTDAFDHNGVALSASVDAAPRMREAFSYGLRLSQDSYDQSAGIANATVLAGFADFRRDTTNTTLDPIGGHIVEFRIEPTISTGDATIGFVRGTAEGRAYQS